jgi:DNA segregation ATPase FtsK/SpoIIIE, S-DNA-T family
MPDRLLRIILRLLLRLFGLVLMGFSLAFLLALLTFNSNDPSFNTVSTQDYIENWMGSFGSHISDLSFQLIGTSSFFLCLIIFSIGAKVSSRFGIRNLLPKIIITPFAILCCSVFFATLPQPSWWEFSSLGGVNGGFILAKLDSITILLIYAI